ncbi:hypothetical protein EXIGLDRAFT_750660 [Exidia glandulosa HHB12029]|uniref:Uncharacterized protein n=1 Tax=Exidia glandulosa HHB12029 TaxID=1314781 RepID=A0A165GFA8_EXIGL|nr:hypothetical protein EXIGLDRAFT_750660 [Exidia glandulosa HHB12029]
MGSPESTTMFHYPGPDFGATGGGTGGTGSGNLFIENPAALSALPGNNMSGSSMQRSGGPQRWQGPPASAEGYMLVVSMADTLAIELELSEDYSEELQTFIKATMFKTLQKLEAIEGKQENTERVVKKLDSERVREWRPSAEQIKDLRFEAKELILQTRRKNFCELGKDVIDHFRSKKDDPVFSDAFSSPAREAQLVSAAGPICSGVRNNLRTTIRDSLYKKKKTDLITFTKKLTEKYLRAGTTTLITESSPYVLKSALLRRFALDFPDKIKEKAAADDSNGKRPRGDHSDSPGADNSRGNSAAPSENTVTAGSRKRQLEETSTETDDHFWLAVDKWLDGLSDKHGGWDWNTPRWRSYFQEIITKEREEVAAFPISTAQKNSAVPNATPANALTPTAGASTSSSRGSRKALTNLWAAMETGFSSSPM